MKRKEIWECTPFVILMETVCCLLWGSAFPSIKIGYSLFQIESTELSSQILFAGLRFALSGIMVIIAGSCIERRFLLPKLKSLVNILILSLFQTVGQYVFFYIGLANTSGVNGSIIEATNTFFTILWACLIFKTEKISFAKIAGCALGFAGVCLIQLKGFDFKNMTFNFLGDGFILISCLLSSFVPSLIKRFTKEETAFVLSGYQFFIGGLVMIFAGLCFGGKVSHVESIVKSYGLLTYLAFISACAYTIWSILMKYNDVSKVAIFGFINPVVGFMLSAIFLGEASQAFSLAGIFSLLLVSLGIILVFVKRKTLNIET